MENELRMLLLLHYSLIAEKIILLKVLLQSLKKYREGHRLEIGFKQPILPLLLVMFSFMMKPTEKQHLKYKAL